MVGSEDIESWNNPSIYPSASQPFESEMCGWMEMLGFVRVPPGLRLQVSRPYPSRDGTTGVKVATSMKQEPT